MNRPSLLIWRPATRHFIIGGLVIILIALVASYMVNNFSLDPKRAVHIGSGVYHLAVADTDAELRQGLSGVKKLHPDGGLLMIFPDDDTWGIWMKDMNIPLDIVWLNSQKKVVYVVENASPELSTTVTFTPKDPARFVLELPAGSIQKAGIAKGMAATFNDSEEGSE